MLAIADIVPPDGVLLHLKAHSLDEAIGYISSVASEITGLRAAVIHESLLNRVRLGTSVGDGVLIPHARLPGLRRVVAFFARPLTPIPNPDGEPITLLFVLLAPEDANAAHLQALSKVAGILRDPDSRSVLHHGSRDAVLSLLTGG